MSVTATTVTGTPSAEPPPSAGPPPSTEELLEHFAPVVEQVRAGAIARELERRLPFEEVRALVGAGFGRVRVPREHGGFGATIEQLTALLVELGRADTNLTNIWRGHIGFTEYVLAHPDAAYRAFWYREFVGGALVGNAESERTGAFSRQATRVGTEDGRLLLNGTKYYTTGSLFADWVFVAAGQDDPVTGEPRGVAVQVRRDDPGVRIDDDWDGFGQRTTGSGTAVFTDVPVDPRFLHVRDVDHFRRTVTNAVFQLVHLAGLAGIARAALEEIADFQRSRTRNLFDPAVPPTRDPLALQVLGETFGVVETVQASVLAAARTVDVASARQLAGVAVDEDFARADAHVYGIQGTVIELVLGAVSRVFEVGGASATSQHRRLDRLWRNARTIGSHNPALLRRRAVGDHYLNGVAPSAGLLAVVAEPYPASGADPEKPN